MLLAAMRTGGHSQAEIYGRYREEIGDPQPGRSARPSTRLTLRPALRPTIRLTVCLTLCPTLRLSLTLSLTLTLALPNSISNPTPKRNQAGPYAVPQGGLFPLVATPHYLFEIVAWLGNSAP